jgi:hypothetical protein
MMTITAATMADAGGDTDEGLPDPQLAWTGDKTDG